LYADMTGERRDFAAVAYAEKRLVLEEMFANAVTHLAHQLADLVAADRRWRDLTRYDLTVAIRELMACLGVYRIYRRMNAECRPEDAREIDRACAEAVRRNPRRDRQPFHFVRDLLVGRYPPPSATVRFRVGLWRWVLTFQQYTGAVMAKSVEDTAFYVYNRFIALNEVGGNPATFGGSAAQFHAENARRRALTPHTLLATSTHDTKFGEDARARLYVLSEIPDEWARWVMEWRRLNREHKTAVERQAAPDANEEYRLYQTLLACWPPNLTEPDETFRERLREYMRKALNEGKRNTHWQQPNEKWLAASDRFVDALLTPSTGRDFLASFVPKARRVAELGLVNSLAQVALKSASPGVPDFYQGCERWNFNLVDPDNRRLIDWSGNETSAAAAQTMPWPKLLKQWEDGGLKLRLTADLLRFRAEHLPLFQAGDYEPVETKGMFASRIVAFRRCWASQCVVVIVPRLSASLGSPPLGKVWEDTAVLLPASRAWRDVLTGHETESGSAPIAGLFRELPLAVLMSKERR
ncbi:MAG: malto-oligosyltrehalose synthase, partial [Opitutaceae bacterium]